MKLDVLDFATPAAALTAANHGDSVYFPGGRVYSGNWQITKSITVYGDGPGVPGTDTGTVLKPVSVTSPVLTLVPPVQHVHVRDMQLRGGGGTSAGVGILCRSTAANLACSDIRLSGLVVSNFPSHGIQIEGFNDSTSKVSRLSVLSCSLIGNTVDGIRLVNVFDAFFLGCLAKSHSRYGVSAIGGAVSVKSCGFDGNCLAFSSLTDANLRLESCQIASVDGCRFTNLQVGVGRKGIALVGCSGAIVGTSYFAATSPSGVQGIHVTAPSGQNCGPIAILPNRFKSVESLVTVDPTADVRDLVLMPQYDETGSGAMTLPNDPNRGMFGSPQVNRGTLGSMRTGLILPQVDADPTVNVQAGMLVYDRAGKLRLHDGTTWRDVLWDP